jgi:hypothetical protein
MQANIMNEALPRFRRINWRGTFALGTLFVVAIAGYVVTLMANGSVTHGT